MPPVPGMGVCKQSSRTMLGMRNGRVWISQGQGNDADLGISCCCSVTSPEPPCSPVSPGALGVPPLVGGVRWVWLGQTGADGDTGGLRAFPRYCLVLTPPRQPLHAQFEGSSQQGAEDSLLLCKAEGAIPIPEAVLELRGDLGGWDTQTPDGSCSASHPKALQPLLFDVANFVRWQRESTALSQGPGHLCPLHPKGTPTLCLPCQTPSPRELSLLCLLV